MVKELYGIKVGDPVKVNWGRNANTVGIVRDIILEKNLFFVGWQREIITMDGDKWDDCYYTSISGIDR